MPTIEEINARVMQMLLGRQEEMDHFRDDQQLQKQVADKLKRHAEWMSNFGYEIEYFRLNEERIDESRYLEKIDSEVDLQKFTDGFGFEVQQPGDLVHVYFLWNDNLQEEDLQSLQKIDAEFSHNHKVYESKNCIICKIVVYEDLPVRLSDLVLCVQGKNP